jgi:hypothetical protein
MIAIAAREKGASWRAQGWAGENADRRDKALIHRKSQVASPFSRWEKETARAHVWTDPGCSWEGRTSKLGMMIGTDLRTVRLAIVQRSTAAAVPCTPRKSQVASPSSRWEKETARAHVWTDPGCS